MATTVTVNSNYAGKEAGVIIGAAFKEADSIKNGLVTMFPNVGSKLNMRKISYTDGTTAYSCGHTPAGAIVLSEKILDPVKCKNDLSVCKEDFRATWSEDSMGASAHNENAPADIMEAIQVEVLGSTGERVDDLIWNGDSGNAGEWDGFITLWDADASVIKANNGITPIGAAITKANVDDEFDKVTAAIPYALRRKDLKFVVSPDVADAYTKYLIENGAANGLGGNANTNLVYGRYTIEVCNGLPDNTIVIYEKKNLVFGTGLEADFNEMKLVDEDEIGLLTGLVRGKMVYSGGCQYYNSAEIIWYLSTTVAS
jgi:hypothetical protein